MRVLYALAKKIGFLEPDNDDDDGSSGGDGETPETDRGAENR
jgi:hypothetical protein